MPGVYLIPDDARAVMHVNGADLHYGTAKVGPAWTPNAYIPYNLSCCPVSSVGPFGLAPYTSTTQYALPPGNPLAFKASQSFSITVVATVTDVGTGPVLINMGDPNDANAYFFYVNGPNDVWFGLFSTLAPGGGTQIESTTSWPLSTAMVVSVGYDGASNNMLLKVNGGATTTGNLGAATGQSTTTATLGNYLSTGGTHFPLNGFFYEALASTNTPSDAFFTSIYNSVTANMLARNQGYQWLQPPA